MREGKSRGQEEARCRQGQQRTCVEHEVWCPECGRNGAGRRFILSPERRRATGLGEGGSAAWGGAGAYGGACGGGRTARREAGAYGVRRDVRRARTACG